MKKESVDAIISGLKLAGINFVSMLPDSDFTDAQKAVMADKHFTCVPVSNEAIGFGVCAGAWLGGKKTCPSHYDGRHHGQRIPSDDIEYAKEHSGTDDRTVQR